MIRFPTITHDDTVHVELLPFFTAIKHARAVTVITESMFRRGFKHVVLDLRHTRRMGPAAVHAIAFLHTTARSLGRTLSLHNVGSRVLVDLGCVESHELPAISLLPEPPSRPIRQSPSDRAATVEYRPGVRFESRPGAM